MEVRVKPETESRLVELASKSGRAPDEIVEDALEAYLAGVSEIRAMIDSRYDDIESGRVKPIDNETAVEILRKLEVDFLKKHQPAK
jgi:predicted transcriptional regulator